MKAIVAVDSNWAIGKGRSLLVHLPGDLRYFKERTLGKTMVMGRETLESLPGQRPLPGRENVVLTRNTCYDADCTICHSEEELLDIASRCNTEDLYIIGGEKVYREFLPYCDTCYVTKIDQAFEADKYFPNLDEDENFQIHWESEWKEENGTRYKFVEYRRKQQPDFGTESCNGSPQK